MNFKRRIRIKSFMSKEQIWKRLHNVSEPYNEGNIPSKFEGSIGENTFKLYQLFDYGNGNLIRPEITSELVQKNAYVEIYLVFNFSTGMRISLWAGFIISIVLIIIQATTSWLRDCSMFPFGWHVHAGFALAGYAIILLIYYNKVKGCTEKFLALSNGKIVDKEYVLLSSKL